MDVHGEDVLVFVVEGWEAGFHQRITLRFLFRLFSGSFVMVGDFCLVV